MDELRADTRLLGGMLGETIRARDGEGALALVEGLRRAAVALRAGDYPGGRDAFAARFETLDPDALALVAHGFTQFFHLINSAEEQHRIRALRRRDRPGSPPADSIAAACRELAQAGVAADEVRALLGRLFIMPVLTAHPTEARRRTVLDHLADVSFALDRMDDPRPGERERARILAVLREAVAALYTTEEARAVRPTPLDEIRAGLHIFERTLLDVTPAVYRELEDTLASCYPDAALAVGPFLRYGSWIGGDRDGNPNVTAEVTRTALERQRLLALARHEREVEALGRELSVSARKAAPPVELLQSVALDRERLPEVAARARRYEGEPWREKLWYMRARLVAARERHEAGYPDARAYLDDLALLERTLAEPGLAPLQRGRLRDARRRAEVFGFHLASLDLRQHSRVHEAATAELLARGGVAGYRALGEAARVELLGRLLERADAGPRHDRAALSPETRELVATLEVVGRARRDSGPEACERYVVSFTHEPSDLLEVLFLARAARLGPDEIRPVPLLEQLEDLGRAGEIARRMLDLGPIRVALAGELEVMIGYSDSGKQAGYVPAAVATHQAQRELARVADERGAALTIFHGRGGAIGRGGGPANRSIRAQPPEALRGRLRVTEQGETVTARYGRPEIARRDLEQMVHAVLIASLVDRRSPSVDAHDQTMERAARAARSAYHALFADERRLAAYAVAATPIQEVIALPIASRPASRGGASIEDLRAIPWVFSWAQSRHGLPGWYGLGTALEAIRAQEGVERLRALYRGWPFFRALVDNAQIALIRADLDVARCYSRLADADARGLFDPIAEEHRLTVRNVLATTGEPALLADRPTIAGTVERRNPYVDVLSHCQIELLRRLRAAAPADRDALREALFITINGIAAGLQTAG